MDILEALRVEESKYLREAAQANQQLETVRAAMKLVRDEANAKSVDGKIDSPSSRV